MHDRANCEPIFIKICRKTKIENILVVPISET